MTVDAANTMSRREANALLVVLGLAHPILVFIALGIIRGSGFPIRVPSPLQHAVIVLGVPAVILGGMEAFRRLGAPFSSAGIAFLIMWTVFFAVFTHLGIEAIKAGP